MEKKLLGEKIKQARRYSSQKTGVKMTQQMLADRIGVSRSYVGDIESGRTYPTFVVLNAIAGVCNLPLDAFTNGNDSFENAALEESIGEKSDDPTKSVSPGLAAIPVLGYIHAGEPGYACEDIIGYEYLPEEITRSGLYFGLKIVGDSMNNSRIFDGDIVIVRRQEEVENGEIAVVLVNGENATVKRLFRTNTMITLMPDSSNKEHQPKFFDASKNEVAVLGKVIKVIINM